MFTGIIETLATVTQVDTLPGACRIRVQTGFADLALGESVAVNGCCLTVTEPAPAPLSSGEALFFVSSETLAVTSLARLRAGSRVNLERAMRVGDRLSGHIVQGHVDGLARLARVTRHPESPESHELRFELAPEQLRYCVHKGSITLDGISLTINSVDASGLSVMIIPHTWTHTNLSTLAEGDALNVEVDVIAKHVERQALAYYDNLLPPI